MTGIIVYRRVSTKEQGASRNGLDSQLTEVEAFAHTNAFDIQHVYTEVASGTLGIEGRPVLAQAIAHATALHIPLVVSKLDRFSRNVSFVASQMESLKRARVPFHCVDLGIDTDPFLMHIWAGLAEKERTLISIRTKAGLAQVKARGTLLGNRTNLPVAQAKGAATNRATAQTWAEGVRHLIQPMRDKGMSITAMCDELNRYGTPTRNGARWHYPTVRKVMLHLGIDTKRQ